MKITAIEAIPYAIPYTHPLKFASGEVTTADHILCGSTPTLASRAQQTPRRAHTPTGKRRLQSK